MGVISVGASLGVADKSSLRAPSVSPSAASAAAASSSVNSAHASHFHGVSTAPNANASTSAASSAPALYNHHHGNNHHHVRGRGQHEYANNHHHPSQHPQTMHSNGNGGGSGRNKRGGRRKYVPNTNLMPMQAHGSNMAAPPPPPPPPAPPASHAAAAAAMASVFPPPPIVTTSSSSSPFAMATPSNAPSPAMKNARIARPTPSFVAVPPTQLPSQTPASIPTPTPTPTVVPVLMPTPTPTAATTATPSPPPQPSQIDRIVTFPTNVEPTQLLPFVLGARGGSRLLAFMSQSKCTIAHRPLYAQQPQEAMTMVVEVVVNPSNNAPQDRHPNWKMSFSISSDTVKKVEHGIRLLHGAIETAELILMRKKAVNGAPGGTIAAKTATEAVAVAAVDSGGNSQPSSGHASASSAAMTDHSIDSPKPLPVPVPAPAPAPAPAPVPVSEPETATVATPAIASSSAASVLGWLEERKAQTRIRHPPANQPLVRGPGLAPGGSIDESVAAAPAAPPSVATVGKKRPLPPSNGEEERRDRAGESQKRERVEKVPSVAMEIEEQKQDDNDYHDESVAAAPLIQQLPDLSSKEQQQHPHHTDADFDEFRIRVTRGIEFARRVDAQAEQVARQLRLETLRYRQSLAHARTLQHQQRVADVVIRTQCAVMATRDGNTRKRRRIEQLSALQHAVQKATTKVATAMAPVAVAPGGRLGDAHMRGVVSSRVAAATVVNKGDVAALVELKKKLAVFKALVVTTNKKPDPQQEAAVVVGEPSVRRATQATATEGDTKQQQQQQQQHDHEYAMPEDPKPANLFRARTLAPGELRDLNLIQDYTNESDCALLQLLVGQRQYFYLEPISLAYGAQDLEQLQHEAVRSPRDLGMLQKFAARHRRFGHELVTQVSAVSSQAAQALATSKAPCWTAMQRSLEELHPLLLGLHFLALHYHAVAVVQRCGHDGLQEEPDDLLVAAMASEREPEDELITAELFKFVLRPIRSSAIESSLHDALPIALVRETIAHCPEVVNHVLDWKDARDVPPLLLEDVATAPTTAAVVHHQDRSASSSSSHKKDKQPSCSSSISSSTTSSSSSSSVLLRSVLTQLQRHADDLDRLLVDLARHLHAQHGGGGGHAAVVVGDKVVLLVNQIKTVAARVLVLNTQLQLHKWTTVFVEKRFSWFGRGGGGGGHGDTEDKGDEEDDEDEELLDMRSDDRSYDKFTCLQDALAVWHNEKLVYAAKENDGDGDGSVAARGAGTAPRTRTRTRCRATEPDHEDDVPEEPEELVALRRASPPEVLQLVETQFTSQRSVAKYTLTSDAIAEVRTAFNDSLAAMRASMKVLGRTAPWRTHVKHSNALKSEHARQRALENKLLLHQWALYYRTHESLPEEDEDKAMSSRSTTSAADKAAEPTPAVEREVVLMPGDTPEIVDMKLLRHEIEQVARQMQAMAPSPSDTATVSDEEERGKGKTATLDEGLGQDVAKGLADRTKLVGACRQLATSCVSALSKFLDRDECAVAVEASPMRGHRLRERANSNSNGMAKESSAAKGQQQSPAKHPQSTKQPNPRTRTAVASTAATTPAAPLTGAPQPSAEAVDAASSARRVPRGEGPVLAATGTTKRAASKKPAAAMTKPSHRRPRALSTSSSSSSCVSTTTATVSASSATTVSSSVAVTSTTVVAEPLRMGCSGCRDTRRRCTGCHGCCLHCVCLGCGCRMCCSSRMAVVQKTVNLLVAAVETRMGCKWLEELDADTNRIDSQQPQTSQRCGLVKSCSLCQQCTGHCTCHPAAQAAHRSAVLLSQHQQQQQQKQQQYCSGNKNASASTSATSAGGSGSGPATAGFPTTASRKERRFRINPTAAQRRQAASATATAAASASPATHSPSDSQSTSCRPTKRTRRSNSDAAPSTVHPCANADAYANASEFLSSDPLSGSSSDGMAFVMGAPPPPPPLPAQHKNEQEDLFRAARVRMKLQRNTFFKTTASPSVGTSATGPSSTAWTSGDHAATSGSASGATAPCAGYGYQHHPSYGLIAPNTLVEGELLWQPDRIRLMWDRKDVYGVLGVPRDATPQLIKRQYRKLVLKLHPDKVTSTTTTTSDQSPPGRGSGRSGSIHDHSSTMDDRVAAFVAVTQSYKLLSGEIGAIHSNAWKTTSL